MKLDIHPMQIIRFLEGNSNSQCNSTDLQVNENGIHLYDCGISQGNTSSQSYQQTQQLRSNKTQSKSFGQLVQLNMNLKVDLSENSLQYSREVNAPLSSRLNMNNHVPSYIQRCYQNKFLLSNNSHVSDCTVSSSRYGVTLMKGNYRRTQEDRFLAIDKFDSRNSQALFAVFDGHSGDQAANFCQNNLEKIFKQKLRIIRRYETTDLMKQAFKELDQQFLAVAKQQEFIDGTTCLVAYIKDNNVCVSHVGDSVAILIRNKQIIELTQEQNPYRNDEYERIIMNNGQICYTGKTLRVQGVLSVTRAIGDMQYKNLLISEPEIQSFNINQKSDDLLIMATDGIFRKYSKQYIVQQVINMREEGISLGEISKKITEKAVEEGCPDNITLMIIDVQQYYKVILSKRNSQNKDLKYEKKEFSQPISQIKTFSQFLKSQQNENSIKQEDFIPSIKMNFDLVNSQVEEGCYHSNKELKEDKNNQEVNSDSQMIENLSESQNQTNNILGDNQQENKYIFYEEMQEI